MNAERPMDVREIVERLQKIAEAVQVSTHRDALDRIGRLVNDLIRRGVRE